MTSADPNLSQPQSAADAQSIERVIDLFEAAWRRNEEPQIDDYLATCDGDRRRALFELVHAELEWRLRRGDHARVEEYCQRYPLVASDDDVMVSLLTREFELRRRSDPDVSISEYEDRFPIYAGKLQPRLRDSEKWFAETQSVANSDSIVEPPNSYPRIPGYDVLSMLGRGGMGMVYKAVDQRLRRTVALKMIRAGIHADTEDLDRFRIEAEAIARLQHPGIVQIFEIGKCAGLPYLSLEFVEGQSLDRRIDGTPCPAIESARLVGQLAEAVQAAHDCGVVHRDLKPANVLLDRQGRPKVTDFGLAKQLDDPSGQTQTGQLMGTPSYMAPEQAAGKIREIGPLSDVYALGAILYELLTGRPPFKATSMMETLEQVRQCDPVPPSQLQAGVPRDLETVCLKCLVKEPQGRYRSAAELKDELDRFLRGEPVQARRAGAAERFGRWCRRNPALAAAGSLAVAALVVATVSLAAFAISRSTAAQRLAEKGKELEKSNSQLGERQKELLNVNEQLKATSLEQRAALAEASRIAMGQGLAYCEQGDVPRGILWLTEALKKAPFEDSALQWEIRTQVNAWRREMPRVAAVLPHYDEVRALAFTRDGSRFATAGREGVVRIWDTATINAIGQPLVHVAPVWSMDFSPDGKTLLTGSGQMAGDQFHPVELLGEASLWDVATSKRIGEPIAQPGVVTMVCFRKAGKEFFSGTWSGIATCWNSDTHEQVGARIEAERPFNLVTVVGEQNVYVSPDGTRIMTRRGTRVQLWDTASGELVGKQLDSSVAIQDVAFSSNSRLVAIAGADRTVRLWNAETGSPIGKPLMHSNKVSSVVFDPRGRTLLTGTDASPQTTLKGNVVDSTFVLPGRLESEVSFYKTSPTLLDGPELLFNEPIHRIRFAGAGRIAIAWGNHLQLWDAKSHHPVSAPLENQDQIFDFAISPDGLTALVAQDKHVWVWKFPDRERTAKILPLPPMSQIVVDQDDEIAILVLGKGAQRFELATGKPIGPKMTPSEEIIRMLTVSPDRKLWAIARTAASQGELIAALASGDSSKLASWVEIWNVATGELKKLPKLHTHLIRSIAFSPDGRRLATGSWDRTARLWNLETGESLGPALEHTMLVDPVAFSPDGEMLLTGSGYSFDQSEIAKAVIKGTSSDQTAMVARLWNTRSGKEIGAPLPHAGPVTSVHWLPSGKSFLTSDTDGTYLWDIDPPERIGISMPAADDAVLSPDGQILVLASKSINPTLSFWSVQTQRRLGASITLEGEGPKLAIDPKGKILLLTIYPKTSKGILSALLSLNQDPTTRLWPLPAPEKGTPEELSHQIQRDTGLEFAAQGQIRALSGERWQSLAAPAADSGR